MSAPSALAGVDIRREQRAWYLYDFANSAFASTVHKAQGSEFDEVALVLSASASPVLTRELLYTAVTRARSRVTLVTAADVLAGAIATPTVRHSGLIARMQEAT